MLKKISLYIAIVTLWGCQTYQPLDLSLETELENWKEQKVGLGISSELTEQTDKDSLNGTLSLKKAQEFAQRFNLEFVTTVKKLAVSSAIAENSGYWQDPSVGIDAGRMLTESEKRWSSGASIGLTIPINGALSLEKKLAEKQKFAEAAVLREKRTELISSLNSAWFEWSSLEQKIALYSNYIKTISDIAERSIKLVDAGELDSTEVSLLALELEETKSSLEKMVNEQKRLRLTVLQLSGIHPDAPCRLMPQQNILANSAKTIKELIKLNPTLLRLKAQVDSADYNYRLELRRQYPDIEFSAGYSDDIDERSIPLGISLTIPIWNRNRQAVASSTAERDVAVANFRAGFSELQTKSTFLDLKLKENGTYAESLKSKVLPLVEKQLDEVIARLKVGEAETLLIYEVLERSLEIREKIIDTNLEIAKTINDIESLNGFDKGE